MDINRIPCIQNKHEAGEGRGTQCGDCLQAGTMCIENTVICPRDATSHHQTGKAGDGGYFETFFCVALVNIVTSLNGVCKY